MNETFGRYHLTEHIFRKGSSHTYLAHAATTPLQQVVVKIFDTIYLNQPDEIQEFLHYASMLKRLKHPGILPMLEIGIEQRHPYAASPYMALGSLRERLNRVGHTRLPQPEAMRILSQVGQALAYTHEQGNVHGNLKPENVLYREPKKVQVADFSLAPALPDGITFTGANKHTLSYMAPEQFAGTISPASDQYALACLAYELFTGRPPFTAMAWSTMREKHTQESPIPPMQLNPDLPASINDTLLWALAKDPAKRYRDMYAFLHALNAVETTSSGRIAAVTPIVPLHEIPTLAATDNGRMDESPADPVSSQQQPSGPFPVREQRLRQKRSLSRLSTWLLLAAAILVIASTAFALQAVRPRSTFPAITQNTASPSPTTSTITSPINGSGSATAQPPHKTSPTAIPTATPTATHPWTPTPAPIFMPKSGPTPTATTTRPTPTAAPLPTAIPTPTPIPAGILVTAINAGSTGTGNFSADSDYDQGNQYVDTSTVIDTSGVSNPAPQFVYQSCRWNAAFTYTIPNLQPQHAYTVRLHWAELTFQVAGDRLFNVAINGNTVVSNLDVFATVGYKKALVKEFAVTANSSGQIVISFSRGSADNPFISGIEVYTA